MSDLLELLDTAEFQTGLRLGLSALAAGWVLFLIARRRRAPLPVGGLLVAGASIGGLYLVGEAVDALFPGLLLIVVGAALPRLVDMPRWAQPLAVVPGAVWFAVGTNVPEPGWVRVLVAVLIPLAGFLITDFELRHDGMGLGQIFFSLSVLGVFLAVPDTEEALVLTAVSLAVALAAWPKAVVSLGPEGAYAAVAVFLWVTAVGGSARPASIVGASGCLALLLLEPVLVALDSRTVRLVTWVAPNWLGAVAASIPQFVLVALCSRVAAHRREEMLSLLIVTLVYAATLGAGLSLGSAALKSRREPA